MIKKIIITGVKGFIGYQLYLKLKEEYDTINSKINYISNLSNKDMWNIDLDLFIREALPEYFNENPIKGD